MNQLHLVFRCQLVAPLLHGAPPAASRRSACRHRGHQEQDLQLVLVLDNQQTWAVVKFYQRFDQLDLERWLLTVVYGP